MRCSNPKCERIYPSGYTTCPFCNTPTVETEIERATQALKQRVKFLEDVLADIAESKWYNQCIRKAEFALKELENEHKS